MSAGPGVATQVTLIGNGVSMVVAGRVCVTPLNRSVMRRTRVDSELTGVVGEIVLADVPDVHCDRDVGLVGRRTGVAGIALNVTMPVNCAALPFPGVSGEPIVR